MTHFTVSHKEAQTQVFVSEVTDHYYATQPTSEPRLTHSHYIVLTSRLQSKSCEAISWHQDYKRNVFRFSKQHCTSNEWTVVLIREYYCTCMWFNCYIHYCVWLKSWLPLFLLPTSDIFQIHYIIFKCSIYINKWMMIDTLWMIPKWSYFGIGESHPI